jgi:hypothetical protein
MIAQTGHVVAVTTLDAISCYKWKNRKRDSSATQLMQKDCRKVQFASLIVLDG